jgi:hypothetical protein
MQFAQAFDPFRSIQAAWKLLKQTPLTVLIGGLLLAFLDSGGGGVGNTFNWNTNHADHQGFDEVWEQVRPWLLVLVPIAICVGLVMFVISSWLRVGFARAIELGLRTGKDDIGKVFDSAGRFGAMLLARLLCGLILFAAFIPLVCAGLALWFAEENLHLENGMLVMLGIAALLLWLPFYVYLALGLSLVSPVIALEDLGPTAGVARAWQLARGHRWPLLWFWIVTSIFSGLGVCACCIGALITMPMAQAMHVEAYVALKSGDQYPQWWIGSGIVPHDTPSFGGAEPSVPAPGAWGSPTQSPQAPGSPPRPPPPTAPPSPPRV